VARRGFLWDVLEDMRRIGNAASPGKDFIVIIGDGGVGSGRGHRKPATKEFIKFLQEFVLVVQVSEYNTSKNCPLCFKQSDFYWNVHHPKKSFPQS
jgi:hypothetical protein